MLCCGYFTCLHLICVSKRGTSCAHAVLRTVLFPDKQVARRDFFDFKREQTSNAKR